jgi:hypothetical protein
MAQALGSVLDFHFEAVQHMQYPLQNLLRQQQHLTI